MSDTQVKIGNALLKQLVEMKEKKGNLNIEDVGAMFESMASSLVTGSSIDNYIRSEIGKMAQYITQAMQEISSITLDAPEEGVEAENPTQNLGLAGAELNAVIEATEKATHDILDATDVISGKAMNIKDKEIATALADATSKIYLACNFQDLTGQRIKKVLRTLKFLNDKINNLKELFEKDASGVAIEEARELTADEKLLSGPQLKAPTQSQIDNLFNSLDDTGS